MDAFGQCHYTFGHFQQLVRFMRALVLGAYGHYGQILCQMLAKIPNVTVIGAGKRSDRLSYISNELDIETILMDWRDKDLPALLTENDIHLVIHAAGPFHNQDYSVAQACIDAGCYYVDLADHRDFVGGIQSLDEAARSAKVLAASGMGLLALTDAIAESFHDKVPMINHMDIGYSGSGAVPGLASFQSYLNICGQSILQTDNGKLIEVVGAGDCIMHHFGNEFASREMVTIDGPELDFLPAKYSLRSISLKGGIGKRGSKALSILSTLVTKNWIKDRMAWATKLQRLARLGVRASQQKGGLFIEVEGRDKHDKVVECVFEIHTTDNRFEELRLAPVVALVKRLMTNFVPSPGAHPAMGLVSLEDILGVLGDDGITVFQG